MLKLLSDLREAAHAAVAIVGSLAASVAVIVSLLAPLGVHVTEAQLLTEFGIAGGVAALISKLIDSANNAIVAHAPTPPPVALLGSTSPGEAPATDPTNPTVQP